MKVPRCVSFFVRRMTLPQHLAYFCKKNSVLTSCTPSSSGSSQSVSISSVLAGVGMVPESTKIVSGGADMFGIGHACFVAAFTSRFFDSIRLVDATFALNDSGALEITTDVS